jgi:hypothetical protein
MKSGLRLKAGPILLEVNMQDLFFLAGVLLFFLLSLGFVAVCMGLKEE